MLDGFERNDARLIVAVVAGGKRYQLSKLKLMEAYPKFEEAYCQTLAPPAEALVTEFEKLAGAPRLQELLADKLYRDMREAAKSKGVRPSRHDVTHWMNTYEGMIFSWWLQLKPDNDLTLEQVEEIVSTAAAADQEFRNLPQDQRVEAALNAANLESQKLADEAKAAETLGEKLDVLERADITPADALQLQKAPTG